MRILLVASLLTVTALAGCLGGADPAGPGEDLVVEAARETLAFGFEGELLETRTVLHAFDMPADALELVATMRAENGLRAQASLAVLDARGDVVDAGNRIVLFRNALEEHPAGAWSFRVSAAPEGGKIPYRIEATVLRGDVPPPLPLETLPSAPRERPEVVVAVLDTGINVYHEAFRAEGVFAPDAVDNGTAPPSVPLTFTASLEESLRADDAAWRSVPSGVLHRFPGTRILGISFEENTTATRYPVLGEASGHGTATAATVLAVEPRATVVMVEVGGGQLAEGIRWAARQPWIDVISVSWGATGNVPLGLATGSLDTTRATRAAADAGKVYVNSAGNDPTAHHTDALDGPPWVIAMSGAEPTTKGRTVLSANGPDFVANFTVWTPSHTSPTAYRWIQGTSFSCPSGAGAFAGAILRLREAVNHTGPMADGALVDAGGLRVDAAQLRDAFNRTARYWATSEYDATAHVGGWEEQVSGVTAPVLPAPWAQMGWGYVDAETARAAAAHLLGEQPAPAKDAGAVAFMGAQQAAREAFWGAALR